MDSTEPTALGKVNAEMWDEFFSLRPRAVAEINKLANQAKWMPESLQAAAAQQIDEVKRQYALG